ncbi:MULTISPECIES: hypothetical protein [unclassified Streptomyces]|uniref:hypothetical protein n=1 Tax=unclassified Streptomyces TaxID=2593676 RepID=UPI0036548ACD
MTGMLRKMGDRALERLVPSTTAQADTSFYKFCYCTHNRAYRKLCHIVGGTTGCTPCQFWTYCN